jgi:hypothetical protein
MNRNDLTPIITATTIPVQTAEFSCGCWGKHEPPYLSTDGIITFDIGVGYKSSKHFHGQNLYILDIADNMALVEMRKFGDMYGAGLWHYLVGIDNGAPWIAHIKSSIDSVAEAVQSLKPAAVKRAEAAGLPVQRQGDWFFIPAKPSAAAHANGWQHGLDGDHRPAEMLATQTEPGRIFDPTSRRLITADLPAGAIYVRGALDHTQHHSIRLDGWHKAIRNNAIRTGRLALRHID